MEFLPNLKLGWLNGWLFLVFFYSLFGLYLLACPKYIVKNLFSVSGWSKQHYILSGIGKPFSLTAIVLLTLSPIHSDKAHFWIGTGIYLVGCVLMFSALIVFRNTPEGQPVRNGIYRYSRNPQWLGLVMILIGTGIAVGNILAMIFCCIGFILYHYRILGEEKACLAAYGQPYQNYLDTVPRYIGISRKVQ